MTDANRCDVCGADAAFLRLKDRPAYETGSDPLRVVDLFSGCGGLSLGLAEAARHLERGFDVRLAVDIDEDAIAVYKANFPKARTDGRGVDVLFDGDTGSDLTASERGLAAQIGPVHVLAGGPPCQGNSDLNNHTRRRDDRNELYLTMARAAEILSPEIVLVENVPGVVHASAGVVAETRRRLAELEYTVEDRTLALVALGAPQRRRRHVLLAYRGADRAILDALADRCAVDPARDIAWAIRDLETPPTKTIIDTPAVASDDNRDRMQWLLDNDAYNLPNERRPECHHGDHSYLAMYGRLSWDAPAQTITTGFGSMGQGRYVHPSRARTLTPHEAARLQMLPDFFDWSGVSKRGSLARLIGNAVPPILASTVLLQALKEPATVAAAVVRDCGRSRAPEQLTLGPAMT